MPIKKNGRSKPRFVRRKKNFKKKTIMKAPSVYRFKREIDEMVALAGTPDGWGAGTDNALGKTFKFALNQVGDFSDFQNLFKYYRIKGARVRMYFSNTVSQAELGDNHASNKQIMIMLDRNVDGIGNPAEPNTYLTSQTKSRFIALTTGRKPAVDVYMPLKQADKVYASAGDPTSLIRPHWECQRERPSHQSHV